ncbi:MAG: hypothetical protein M9894_33035 [Planctomycetes bacterium]|nr:hypothetical protein [Planctomycetota bacterium]
MKLTITPVVERFLRSVQRAFARAVRAGAPRVAHPDTRGPVGGSLADDVLRETRATGGTFLPSRLGLRFRLWWHGSGRQRARGRDVVLDEAALARALAEDLARQLEAEDGRAT